MRQFIPRAPLSLLLELGVARLIGPFLRGNMRNLRRRLFYSYFLRGFSAASLELLIGTPLFLFGVAFGVWHWYESVVRHEPATAGTVMLAALPMILGTQFILSWLNFDVAAEPRHPVHALLGDCANLSADSPVLTTKRPNLH